MTKLGCKKTTKRKPIKKVGQKTLQRKADILFSKLIRELAGNKCEFCGGTGVLHCHHGIAHRRYLRTRYLRENAVCLCVECHNKFGDFPSLNMDFFRKHIGSDRIEQVFIMANTITGEKFDYYPVIEDLQKKLKGKSAS
jgi:5-methylcytosine-specific restriction endonuclease McrA